MMNVKLTGLICVVYRLLLLVYEVRFVTYHL